MLGNVKVSKVSEKPSSTPGNPSDTTKVNLALEVAMIHRAKCPHVISLIDAYFQKEDDSQNEDGIRFSVIMEPADWNLDRFLRGKEQPEGYWFGCLIEAVRYVHDLGSCHKNIKPSNILVKGKRVLLADFGISKWVIGKAALEEWPTTMTTTKYLRTDYQAPEVDGRSVCGSPADIFSLGGVFLEMLIAYTRSKGSEERAGLKTILRTRQEGLSYAKNIDALQKWMDKLYLESDQHKKILSVCQEMLQPDQNRRPSAQALHSRLSTIPGTCKLVCRCT